MNPLVPIIAIGAGALAIKEYLESREPRPERLANCAAAIEEYYDASVRLGTSQQRKLAKHRNANRLRIREGLARRGAPKPLEFIAQGSYAMDTIIVEPNNAYDIDDGVVFDAPDLVGARGAPLSALEARRLIFDCLDDDKRISPQLRSNCVRIPYSKGYHVDVPVYRRMPDGALEHAGSVWQAADPRGVTEWFQKAVETKSPDSTNGRQMRRVVRLIKRMFTTRSTWNTPSGFILSRLVEEVYTAADGRDDAALYITLFRIRRRLDKSLVVSHPVVARELTRGPTDPRMTTLRDALTELLVSLAPLKDSSTAPYTALTAWREAFNDPYLTVIRDQTTEKIRR